MSDFNNINPDKSLKFNTNRQARGGNQEPTAGNEPTTPPTDPYANMKTDPDKMLNLMAAQGKQNIPQMENPAIERSVNAFTKAVSPEHHAQVTNLMTQTYQNETGKKPSAGLIQDMVDDYLIGKPVIQNS